MGIERISEFWPSWNVVELLGKGGNGEVYKCVHEEMGVKTYSAIKVIKISSRQMTSYTFDTASIQSFCRNLINDCVNEINVMLSLKSCPNIVAIEDFKVIECDAEDEWEIFIRMELLTCLTDYLKDRVLTQNEIIKLGLDLCSALELCHSKNIIHRDIKPANIFINELGDFKLGDFGIARKLDMVTAGLSQKGTLTYVAPEVMYSNDYKNTVDIYSLGLVMYQLANNNRLPFFPTHGDFSYSMQDDAIKHRLRGDVFPPACNADESLNSIFRIACEFEPKNRFQSASQMKESLMSFDIPVRTYYRTPVSLIMNQEVVVSSPTSINAAPIATEDRNEMMTVGVGMVQEQTVSEYQTMPNATKKLTVKRVLHMVSIIILAIIISLLLVQSLFKPYFTDFVNDVCSYAKWHFSIIFLVDCIGFVVLRKKDEKELQ